MRFAAVLLVALACPSAFASGSRPQTQTVGDCATSQNQIDDLSTNASAKVTLCHIPPGSPANAQTIVVGQAAVTAHLAHGDYLGKCNPTCGGVPSAVPTTGQTRCSDAFGNPIDCAGTGQDGEYQSGASVSPRFTDNGDGTVNDNLTGLIWLKDAACLGLRNWTDALLAANTLSGGACGLTDGSTAGDWRLPNVKELESLNEFGVTAPTLPADNPFSGVQPTPYWSSTTYLDVPRLAWDVGVFGGATLVDGKRLELHGVWAVRGPR